MKKILSASLLASAFVLSSCYCDKTYVGNVGPYDQVVHVASTRNAHIFGGAVVTHNPVKAHYRRHAHLRSHHRHLHPVHHQVLCAQGQSKRGN